MIHNLTGLASVVGALLPPEASHGTHGTLPVAWFTTFILGVRTIPNACRQKRVFRPPLTPQLPATHGALEEHELRGVRLGRKQLWSSPKATKEDG